MLFCFMFEKFGFTKKLSKEEEIEKISLDAKKVCEETLGGELADLDIAQYQYSSTEAIEELGLDDELIHQLLEDYVSQILKSLNQFKIYINKLKYSHDKGLDLDYTPLRELAHKNLGVARNLRIKDAEKLLYILMKKDNLSHLRISLKVLEACAIRLKPACAYNTLNIMKVKSAF